MRRRASRAGARARRHLPLAVIAAAVVALVIAGVLAPGASRSVLALDDGGVWVTNGGSLQLGRLNYPSRVLDGGLLAKGSDLDVLQQGSQVVLVDATSGTAGVVDPASVAVARATPLPAQATVLLGGEAVGGVVGVFSAKSHRVWTTGLSGLASLQTGARAAVQGLGAVTGAAMGADGSLYTVDRRGRVSRVAPGGTVSSLGSLAGWQQSARPELTVVGSTPVVSDPAARRLWVGATALQVEKGVRLQAPSASGDDVVYATSTGLVKQPLDGGRAVTWQARTGSSDTGAPAAPVVVAGCAYGAWSGTDRYGRWCGGAADDRRGIPALTGDPVFRANRTAVVLNDPSSGAIWLVNDGMQQVKGWDSLLPPDDGTETDDAKSRRTVAQTAVELPDRSEDDTEPTAEPDRFGARAGSTITLPVLDNDTDPDGDVLTASVDGDTPFGRVTAVQGGAALQVHVARDAPRTGSFRYTADDGRGGTDSATVELTVVPDDTDHAPEYLRPATVSVETGATVTFDALTGWSDPDGDDLQMTGAAVSGGDSVRSTPDGVVTYSAVGGATGRHDLQVTVSDGTKHATGTLTVTVKPARTAAPIANNDRATTTVGEPVTVEPLANDIDPSAVPLSLVRVQPAAGSPVGEVVPDFTRGTFTFTAQKAGEYYLQYKVANGPASNGLVRIDVAANAGKRDPIAMRDVAYLPSGGQVTIDPLENDVDPGGGVLVLQSVEATSQASVALVRHAQVRIADTGSVREPFEIGYTVANTAGSSTGTIRVVPVAVPAKELPPVASPDRAVVRAGDVVSVDVLANDVSPSGARLRLVSSLSAGPEKGTGTAFVSGSRVRFAASGRTGTVHITYEVTDGDPDGDGVRAAGVLTLQVTPRTGANEPPRPLPVVGRVLQGRSVLLPVPLDGIDPDGDSVQLIGVGGAQRGRAEVTTAGLRYTAAEGQSGTDRFTYTVQDRLGKSATGQVRVGIAAASAQNQAPTPVADTVRVRPGRQVAVDVLANDSDPDGDALRLAGTSGSALDAEVAGGRIAVRTPAKSGQYTATYRVADARGAAATGQLVVTVDPDAPLRPPVARDDVVTPQQIAGQKSVSVPVLENDDDPDGVAAALQPATTDSDATARGTRIVVAVTKRPQVVLYTVTDRDGLTGTAVIRVPGAAEQPPVLRRGVKAVQVVSGGSAEIRLANYVVARGGRAVSVARLADVPAQHGTVKADAQRLSYRASADYSGPDTISLEVTDGTGPDDRNGLKALISIPVQVRPASNEAPIFSGGQLTVGAGEDAVAFDLRGASADPNPGDLQRLTYRVGQAAQGLTARVDGARLLVSAADGARDGTVEVIVSDGSEEGRGTVDVTVTASVKPLAVALTDVVADAKQGVPVDVDVLANDTNPFPDEPLKIVDARVISAGAGTVTAVGGKVRVTPGAQFTGTLIGEYTVQDASGDAHRQVQGRIEVTVRGVPDAPGAPTAVTTGSRTVTLSWVGGAANGSPITGYGVTSDKDATVRNCPTTTCTIDGLDNGTEYRFQVAAVNAVGTSKPSAQSAAVLPDARPEAPTLTDLGYGDGTLKATWRDGAGTGSATTGYTVDVLPGQSFPVPAGTNTFTIPGLANGAQYRVDIRATNRAGDSDASNVLTESPAGAPGQVAAPKVTPAEPVGKQTQVTVDWTAPDPNAEAITGYEVQVSSGQDARVVDVAAGTTTATVAIDNTGGRTWSFAVAAKNKATDANKTALVFGPKSAGLRFTGIPDAPTGVTATAGNNSIGVTWTESADDLNGLDPGEVAWQYSLNGDGNWRAVPAVQGTYSATLTAGIANGNSYTVSIRATGAGRTGQPSGASNAVRPFGQPGQPTVNAAGNANSVTFNWAPPASNGRDIDHLEIKIDGGGAETVGAGAGSRTVGSGYSENHRIEVTAVDTEGQRSPAASAAATSGSAPQPTASLSKGDNVPVGTVGCANGQCQRLRVNYTNLPVGTYSWQCFEDGAPYANSGGSNSPVVQAGGNGSVQLSCFYGYPGHQVKARLFGGGADITTPEITW